MEKRQAQLGEAASLDGEGVAPGAHAAVGHDLADALDRVHHVRAQVARGLAGAGAEPIDARSRQHRHEGGEREERYEDQRHGPREGAEDREHRERNQHRDQRGRHRVREEVLDQLDVVGGDADEIARAPAGEIGRRQCVELAERRDAHVGEQPIGDVVSEPGLDPVQDAGDRRDDGEPEEQGARRLAVPDGAHRQRAQDSDPDEGDHPDDAEHERERQTAAIAARLVEQRAEHRAPADLATNDRIDRLGRLDGIVLLGFGDPRHGASADRHRPRTVLGLAGHEPGIGPAARHQLGVRPVLDDPPLVQHQDPVGADHARQPVGEHERGAPHHQAVERGLDERLALGVHRRQRLVEHEDRRVAQQCARAMAMRCR